MRCPGISPARRAGLVMLAAAPALALAGAMASPAAAATPSRVSLPSPNTYGITGTPAPLDPGQEVALRVYLAGRHPTGRVTAALAAATPGSPAYARYLTPAQYQDRFGATAAQITAVTGWLTAQGMAVTASTPDYIAVQATVAEVNRAFGTQVSGYVTTTVDDGYTYTSTQVGMVGGFSVPAALGADVATVTGLDETTVASSTASPVKSASPSRAAAAKAAAAKAAAAKTVRAREAASRAAAVRAAASRTSDAAAGHQCSAYWGQHVAAIPAAYGRTTAPTNLCGYTPAQLRKAYGITASGPTGKGETIAVVLNEAWPTMLADANRFFASHGVGGFAPGQYTENYDSGWAATCGVLQSQPWASPDPEEAIDVESAHIAAPAAKVVLVAADCDPSDQAESPLVVQDLLDATTRVVDGHLADVVTSSWGFLVSYLSPADVAAWNLVFQQGALEGIGFDYSSGDGAADIGVIGPSATVQFPAADPWVTAVGGTTLAIGQRGTASADYPWNDNVTQVDSAGTGYTAPPPGDFQAGSGGGVSALFAEPGYQKPVVPATLATANDTGSGAGRAHRVVPDISADSGGMWLIGYTGAVTQGAYDQIPGGGGTSGASPLIAGLEADAMQAAGHALGFVNPALYRLHGSPAISDITPVNPDDPPVLFGGSIYFGSGDYLDTVGEDSAPLQTTTGYDDVTGLGAPGHSFVTAFTRF